MDDISKLVYYNNLFQIYQGQLSTSQREVLSDYFEANLSISEIASERGVSRAAIEDAIKKGMKKLDALESDLKIYSKQQKALKIVSELKEASKDEADKLIKQLEEVLK